MGVVLRRRTPSGPGVVAVSGAGAGLGRALIERLADREDLDGLVGLDAAPARVDGVVWRGPLIGTVLGAPDVARRLAGVTTLVHAVPPVDPTAPPAVRREATVRGAADVLAAARTIRARRVVLCTAAEVYAAHPDNPVPLPDAAPLQRPEGDGSPLDDLLAIEELVAEARATGLAVTVLRPASVVGLPPGHEGSLLRQLGAQRLLAVRGVEPLWQLCHLEDLLAALELAVTGAVTGDLGVASDGALPQVVVETLTGKRRLELPAGVALSTAERLHRLGISASSPHEIDHLLGTRVLACDGLRAVGWAPCWTNEAALEAHLRSRSGDGRSAAYTAAGATVALLGTAALVRRARRRRGR